jgi:hypothetical protein
MWVVTFSRVDDANQTVDSQERTYDNQKFHLARNTSRHVTFKDQFRPDSGRYLVMVALRDLRPVKDLQGNPLPFAKHGRSRWITAP